MLLGVALSFFSLGMPQAVAQPAETRSAPPTLPRVRLRYADAPPASYLVTRLKAELTVAGFAVELRPESSADERGEDVYAEVHVLAERALARLEIESRASVASTHVVLVGAPSEGPALALQATEFLRAGLLPRVAGPEPPPAPPPRTPAVREPAPPPSGRALLDVGGAWLTTFRSGDRSWALSLGAGYAFPRRLTLSVGADLPLTRATFSAPRGEADYRLWLGAWRADYAWLRFRGGEANLGLGVGFARVTSAGRPSAPLEARQPGAWALALDARLSVELRVSQELGVFARARVLSLSPNPVIAILEEERRLGAPTLLFELGARLGGRR